MYKYDNLRTPNPLYDIYTRPYIYIYIYICINIIRGAQIIIFVHEYEGGGDICNNNINVLYKCTFDIELAVEV